MSQSSSTTFFRASLADSSRPSRCLQVSEPGNVLAGLRTCSAGPCARPHPSQFSATAATAAVAETSHISHLIVRRYWTCVPPVFVRVLSCIFRRHSQYFRKKNLAELMEFKIRDFPLIYYYFSNRGKNKKLFYYLMLRPVFWISATRSRSLLSTSSLTRLIIWSESVFFDLQYRST